MKVLDVGGVLLRREIRIGIRTIDHSDPRCSIRSSQGSAPTQSFNTRPALVNRIYPHHEPIQAGKKRNPPRGKNLDKHCQISELWQCHAISNGTCVGPWP
jgi:hypothetical protein